MCRTWIVLLAALTVSINAHKTAFAAEPPAPRPPAPLASSIDDLAEKHALLEEKLAELARLQTEVDALRAETHTPSMIVVNVELLEVSRTKMRRLGLDVHDFTGNGVSPASFDGAFKDANGVVQMESGPGVVKFIEALKANGVAKTLAEPTIATISGKHSVIRMGGSFPVPVPPESAETRKWGTELDVLAEALGNNRVRLNLRLELCEPSDDGAVVVDGQKIPSLKSRAVDTACELQFGETLVLGGLLLKRIEAEVRDGKPVEQVDEVEMLTVLKAESVEEIDEVRAAPQFAPGERGLIEVPAGPVSAFPRAYSPPPTATRRTAPHDSMHK
jgi:hypothetical protein